MGPVPAVAPVVLRDVLSDVLLDMVPRTDGDGTEWPALQVDGAEGSELQLQHVTLRGVEPAACRVGERGLHLTGAPVVTFRDCLFLDPAVVDSTRIPGVVRFCPTPPEPANPASE